MEYFDRLGSYVRDLWKQKQYDERCFPQVAYAALSEMPPYKNTSFEEVVEYALRSESLPTQADLQGEFGQPPLTVYSGRDFRIEVLFWTGATPAIHQHAFSGAFHVMHGSSLHTTWDCKVEERVSSHLLYGQINLGQAELLNLGDIRIIHCGPRFIHATFHLETPTVSIVVRTTNEQDQLPQYAYLPPTICYNARDNIASIKRKEQILAMLVNAGRAEQHDECLHQLFASSDPYSLFHYLYQANLVRDKQAFEELLSAAAVHQGKLVENMRPAASYVRRQGEITKLRSKVTNLDLRFLLALLINVPDGEALLRLVRSRWPDEDPISKFIAGIKQLSDADQLGEKLSDPWLLVLECLLRGLGGKVEIERAFVLKYGEAQVQNQRTKIQNLAESVRHFWLFRPLFDKLTSDNAAGQTVPMIASRMAG